VAPYGCNPQPPMLTRPTRLAYGGTYTYTHTSIRTCCAHHLSNRHPSHMAATIYA